MTFSVATNLRTDGCISPGLFSFRNKWPEHVM